MTSGSHLVFHRTAPALPLGEIQQLEGSFRS
jgi:hypothetical protein